MKRRSAHGLVLTLAASMIGCGQTSLESHSSEAWERFNAPEYLTRDYLTEFAQLPLRSNLTFVPYADSYWPSNRGGIAYRWYVEESAFDIELYDKADLAEFTMADMRELSPAEKYDILRSAYDYPLTQYELDRTDPEDPEWYGLCHGWAAASGNFSEPGAIILENADGIKVPLMSADIKALLAFAQQAPGISARRNMLGIRCMSDLASEASAADTPQCKGVNAGTFHLILTNLIAFENRPLVVDIDRSVEVWNYTAYGYHSEILRENVPIYDTAASGTTRILQLKTYMKYQRDIEPMAEPHGDQDIGQREQETYEYYVELNSSGEIIGGEWISDDRPDFLWDQNPPDLSAAEWRPLQKILTKAGVTPYKKLYD